MVDQSIANESKQEITIDGSDAIEVKTENVALLSTRIGGMLDVHVGPDGEYKFEYDESNGKLKLIDATDNTAFTIEDNTDTLDLDRIPLAPEYDTVSNAPQNPRGIVRFTANSSKTPGLYSYSSDQSAWIQLDKP